MANISQSVNIEMLEKLPDGTYKRKYPKTRSDTGVTFDEHLADDVQHNRYVDNGKTYQYGFKPNTAKDGLIYSYEEVI